MQETVANVLQLPSPTVPAIARRDAETVERVQSQSLVPFPSSVP